MQTKENRSHKTMLTWIALGLVLIIGAFVVNTMVKNADLAKKQKRVADYQQAYTDSLRKKEPAALREMFLTDIKNGVNDAETRSAALWIMHRYFDNGGDIYEIHDFISSKPELAYLNTEGERITPEFWKLLKDGVTPHSYSTRAKMILLAYLQVLDEHGYGGIGLHAMIAHLSAYENLYSIGYVEDFPKDFDHKKFRKEQSERALKYVEKAAPEVTAVLEGKVTPNDVPARDLMLALDEYGAALRFLELSGTKFTPQHDPKVVFTFATKLAATQVPELYFFTCHLNASTYVLTMSEDENSDELARILYPFTNMPRQERKPGGIIDRILSSRTQTYQGFDQYSKSVIQQLGRKVPAYKAWLMENGWVASDFK